jgi:Ca-activated chloride channel family protein
MELSFSSPEYIWVLPLLVITYCIWRYFSKSGFVATTTLRWLEPVLQRPSTWRQLPAFLLTAAVILTVLALMDPQLPYSEREVESLGLDIAIVLDLSASMQEVMSGQEIEPPDPPDPNQTMSLTPLGKTRLDTTKDALRDFISRRYEDRIGLVVFSDNAYVVSPLTLDYDYLFEYLDMIDGQILRGEGMTAIGEGIALANVLLYRQRGEQQRNQVIVVFTDGEHNIGRDPLEVLPQVNAAGIRVHAVGVDIEQRIREKEAVMKLIEAIKANGGSYFDANSEAELLAVTSELDSLEKHLLISKQYVQQMPVYHWFALPALIFILIAVTLRTFPWFSDFT